MSQPRSAAAQFFLEEEEVEEFLSQSQTRRHQQHQQLTNKSSLRGQGQGILSSKGVSERQFSSSGVPSLPPRNVSSRADETNDFQEEQEVAELLTRATVISNDSAKLELLMRVTEIIVEKQPALLDNFLDEMLNFQSDSSIEIRKYLLDFIEQACNADPETIPKIAPNIRSLLSDRYVSVQKRAIQATSKIYHTALVWLCRSKSVTEEMENAWIAVTDLKRHILGLIDSDNDGIRTHTVKFMEIIILLQTPSESDSLFPSEFCLDQVPITVKVARPRKLEEDAKQLFEELLKFYGSRHATSVNLMACMGSISLIAKLRPYFMGKVVTAMEKLNAILPPTLERSQVSSVRKHMKIQLISLLKHPRAVNYYDSITTLLTDLGATNSELHRAVPNWDEIRAEKRKRQRGDNGNRKRPKLQVVELVQDPLSEYYDDDEDMEKTSAVIEETKDDVNADELENTIYQNLSHSAAVELVLASMDRLPDTLPAHFMSSFTPIAIAGTESQIRHVSRLLAAQITAYQLGPAAALQVGTAEEETDEPSQIPSLVSSTPAVPAAPGFSITNVQQLVPPFPPPAKRKIAKALKLSEITKPLAHQDKEKHLTEALKRILSQGERFNEIKCKLIASVAVIAPFSPRYFVMQFINESVKSRLDLGIQWLFAEYSLWQGFVTKSLPVLNDSGRDRYDWTFFNLMKGILDTAQDADKSSLAWRLYTEPPIIPDRGVLLLKTLCGLPNHGEKAMHLLLELARNRPRSVALHYLSVLLEFCSHSLEEIRNYGVAAVLEMYDSDDSYKKIIEDHAIDLYLKSLKLAQPPENLFVEDLGRKEVQKEWNENTVKSCLHLYFQLLAIKHSLVHELANVYVDSSGDVKRIILRIVDAPIRKLGIDSPELMKLIDSFPKGAETLMTRILHILTDKTLPTTALVTSIRNIYLKRVGDVRFLIPVLNGLSKSDILAALPKLIKLNPIVVKEVFNRLLGIHADAKSQHSSPVSPVELMVALHNIDPSKCDVKSVIKATSLCFNEADVFTAEVLAVVINQLLEQTPLPTLLMRTVIQTLALYSKLTGFVMNTLSRLVGKQVWNQPKIWEGFIKCCQRTLPKSIPVLLTLPPEQLKQALIKDAPDLRRPIVDHLMSFSEQQRSCMPPALLNVVFGSGRPENVLKSEYPYPDYDGEISEITDRRRNSSSFVRVKEERRSPGRTDLSIAIKDEPMEYND